MTVGKTTKQSAPLFGALPHCRIDRPLPDCYSLNMNYQYFNRASYRLRDIALRKGERGAKWFMPYNINLFREHLEIALRKFPEAKTFLDVGCGTGDKLHCAGNFRLEPSGIELSKTLAGRAVYFGNVFQQDAMTFQSYNSFDIVYLWNPIPTDCSLELMYTIKDQIRDKCVIISPYPTRQLPMLEDADWTELAECVWANF